MNIAFFFADSPTEYNCSRWNCEIPHKAINKTGEHTSTMLHINEFVKNTEEAQKACIEADIIIVERNYFGDCLTMMQFWKVRGKTVMAIFDDAYDIMHQHNPSYNFWNFGEVHGKDGEGKDVTMHMNPLPLEQFKWALRIVKGIQVPSVNLARDWSKYGTTYHVHNYLEMDDYLNVEPLIPHEGIVIGWCGSMSHFSSFSDSGVADALRKISKRHPDVKFLIGGDKRVFDLLEVNNKVYQEYVPASKWTSLLKTIDIGLAPLSGEYDKRRSWIKGLEYMALKIPWVGTNYLTYSELSKYATMTENGYKNWETALEDSLEHHKENKEKAETEGFDFACSQSSDKNIKKTISLYKDIIKTPYI